MDSTTIKGFRVLEKLAESNAPRGVSELAREIRFTKSNTQRILATLCALGYAERDRDSKRYRATLRLWQLGVHVLLQNGILRAARSPMKSLYAASGETVVLCVPEGDEIVYLEKMESENPVRLSCAIGIRLSIGSTATGRVIAAFRSSEERERLRRECKRRAGRFPGDLWERFENIRKRGYELSEGGYRAGVNSIAAPLRDASGAVVASIGLSGPEERLGKARLIEVSPLLLDAAATASGSLGYLGQDAGALEDSSFRAVE